MFLFCNFCVFFFKQKTAYEMRISDWSSDVCSSDLMRNLTDCINRCIFLDACAFKTFMVMNGPFFRAGNGRGKEHVPNTLANVLVAFGCVDPAAMQDAVVVGR